MSDTTPGPMEQYVINHTITPIGGGVQDDRLRAAGTRAFAREYDAKRAADKAHIAELEAAGEALWFEATMLIGAGERKPAFIAASKRMAAALAPKEAQS